MPGSISIFFGGWLITSDNVASLHFLSQTFVWLEFCNELVNYNLLLQLNASRIVPRPCQDLVVIKQSLAECMTSYIKTSVQLESVLKLQIVRLFGVGGYPNSQLAEAL